MFTTVFKPLESSRVTPSPDLDLDQSCQKGEQAWAKFLEGCLILNLALLICSSLSSLLLQF